MATSRYENPSATPITLLLPDLDCSADNYWQTHWQRSRLDCHGVDFSTRPDRNNWVAKLDAAMHRIQAPIVLVGHGLGALTIAAWAELMGQEIEAKIAGALLVGPRDPAAEDRLASFAPLPSAILPFPALVVAGDDDGALSLDRAFSMARQWGAGFARFDNCADFHGLGLWPDGEELLDRFIELVEPGHESSRAGLDAFASQSILSRGSRRAPLFRL